MLAARRAGVAALTSREREVLSLMAQGRSNAGIGEVLVLSTCAVEKHVASIFGKPGRRPLSMTTGVCWRSCATSRIGRQRGTGHLEAVPRAELEPPLHVWLADTWRRLFLAAGRAPSERHPAERR